MAAGDLERSLERMSDGLLCLDREGLCVYLNPRAGEVLGRAPRSLIGKHLWTELSHLPLRRASEEAAAGQKLVHLEDHDAASGRWIETRIHPGPDGLTIFFEDVTARHAAEKELRNVAAASAQAERMAHVGFWQWDVAANRVAWSDELYRIYGLSKKDFGASLEGYLERVHPEDRDRVRATVETALGERRPFTFEERIVRPDGVVRHLQSWGTVSVGAGGEPKELFGTCLDVTDRKHAELLLAGESSVLERISANAPLAESLDLLARTMDSQAPGNLSSIVLIDADGKHMRHAAGPGLPDAYNRLVDGLPIGPAAASCGTAAFRREKVFVSDIATDPLWARYRPHALEHGLRACWSTPIFAADGALLGTFAIYRREASLPSPHDLEIIARSTHVARIAIESDRARDALRRTNERLLQAQKMESVGRLASSVAHDFNNVLSIVMSTSDIIAMSLDPSDPRRAHVEEIQKAGIHAASLTRQLLIFARQQVAEPRLLDLNVVLGDIEPLVRRLVGGDVRVEVSYAPTLGRIKGDSGRLEQIVLNLCANARDAMPRGGTLTITTENVDAATPIEGRRGRVEPGRYVRLAVRDTGSGMTPSVLARLFEPFFTTKELGRGTGLGLSTVETIVGDAGGAVVVDTEVGKGSAFAVYFSRASSGSPREA